MPRGQTWGRWSSGAYTRGGAGLERRGPPPEPARSEKRPFPLAPKDLPVGEKTKTVGNWADMPGVVPTVRGDAGARRCPPRLRARGGGVRVGFWCETGADDPPRRRRDWRPRVVKRDLFLPSPKECGKQDFSPGGSGSCAFAQTGNGAGRLMNRACQSFDVGLALSGSINYGHCMVQYSTIYAAHSGRKKKLWLKHVLLPWVVYCLGVCLATVMHPRSRCSRPCLRGSGTWIL